MRLSIGNYGNERKAMNSSEVTKAINNMINAALKSYTQSVTAIDNLVKAATAPVVVKALETELETAKADKNGGNKAIVISRLLKLAKGHLPKSGNGPAKKTKSQITAKAEKAIITFANEMGITDFAKLKAELNAIVDGLEIC